jgi:hypothetical protein
VHLIRIVKTNHRAHRVFKLKILGSSGFSVEFIHNFSYLEGSSITPLLDGSLLHFFTPPLRGLKRNALPLRERVLFYPHNPQKNQILFLCVLYGEIHFLWFHIFSSFFMKLLTLPTHLSSGLRTPRMFFIAT